MEGGEAPVWLWGLEQSRWGPEREELGQGGMGTVAGPCGSWHPVLM